MSGWTPGPWSIQRASQPNGPEKSWDYAIYDSEQTVIAEAFEKVGYGDVQGYKVRPVEANARLIVSAPCLAGAAKGVIDWIEGHFSRDVDADADAVENLRSALQKAGVL